MPLSLAQLEEIQSDCLADDIEIVFEKMSLWDEDTVREYFENGGQLPPGATLDDPKGGTSAAAATSAPPLPPVPEAEFKKWFPRWQKAEQPRFRLVCFHNAGSSESVWTGRGLRQTADNPFVRHCREAGGELLAVELPGREARRSEGRETQLGRYAEAIFRVLAPVLQEAPAVPYVLIGHSMGTWLLFELSKLLQARGVPSPAQVVVSGFCAPDIPERERPWSRNGPMDDEAFKQECRGWDVNAVVFAPANWGTFSPIMRDDFTLFDAYEYAPAPAPLAVPVRAFYAAADKRIKKTHLEGWRRFTTASFSVDEVQGHHLFFYDPPQRAAFMNAVLAGLPDEFHA
eukprot:Transcript_22089.p1 GENE.Transcript_22089~~Transcript_22089.p1  ORF type:complete len:376 (-),score=139.09 Transcript_22089:73-1104(-)